MYSRITQAMIERNAGIYDKEQPEIIKVGCQRHDKVICACIKPCPACLCMTKLGGKLI